MAKKCLLTLFTITLMLFTLMRTTMFQIQIQQASAQNPMVVASQIYNLTSVGTSFLFYINVSDVVDLNAFVMNISWNPEVIRLSEGDPKGIIPRRNQTKYNIYLGDFLNTTYWGVESANNDEGCIRYLWGARAKGGVSGSGVLVILNFTLIGIGTTKVEITNHISNASQDKCMLINKDNKEIDHGEIDGIISDQPPPTPKLWEELWFQSTILGVVCVAGVIIFYTTVWKKVRVKRLLKMSREAQPIYEEDEPNIQL